MGNAGAKDPLEAGWMEVSRAADAVADAGDLSGIPRPMLTAAGRRLAKTGKPCGIRITLTKRSCASVW
jgi:hypothetical protein